MVSWQLNLLVRSGLDMIVGEFPVMRPEEAAQFEPELTRIPKTKEFHFE